MKKLILLAAMACAGIAANAQLVESTLWAERTPKKSNTIWYTRLGMSFNNASGFKGYDDGVDKASAGTKVGYEWTIGFQKPIAGSDVYFGMEFALGTRGMKFTSESTETGGYSTGIWTDVESEKASLIAHTSKIVPINFGYKYAITDDIKLDGHLGGFFSYDYAGKLKYTEESTTTYPNDPAETESNSESYGLGEFSDYGFGDYTRYDAGLQVGIGVWFQQFNLDFTYQKGFITQWENEAFSTDGTIGSIKSSNFMIRLGYSF